MKPSTLIVLMAITAASLNPAMAAEPGDEAVETLEAVANDAAPVAASSPSEAAASRFSDGMRIPVDGTSEEAFDKSLEAIGKQATKAEFTTLNNAIDYLLVYDLSAKKNRARLAANLDGLTGEQILERVQWRKGEKYKTNR